MLLLDEPLSNLDAKLREVMQIELRRIQQQVGITTIMVTHDQGEALSISDRVMVMEKGRATQYDTPLNVYENPQSPFISTFVGKANMLRGVALIEDGKAYASVSGMKLALDGDLGDGRLPSPGQELILSLRPEKLRFTEPGRGFLDAQVKEKFFFGSQWHYTGDLAARAIDGVAAQRRPSADQCRRQRRHRLGRILCANCPGRGKSGNCFGDLILANSNNKLTPWALSLPGLVLFVSLLLIPMLMTIVLSFNVYDMDTGAVPDKYTIAHYLKVLGDSYYYEIFFRTYWISLCVALVCVVIGVPEAYIISRMRSPWRSIMLLVVLAPLLVSVVVRAFGWSLLLNNTGLVNSLLTSIGVGPVRMMYTETAVIIALVHVMLPFMVIPVWTSLQKLDPAVENAALSLGASPFTTLTRVVFPQVMPGILSGTIIVFGLTRLGVRDSRPARRAAHQNGRHLGLRPVQERFELAAGCDHRHHSAGRESGDHPHLTTAFFESRYKKILG